jgi:hypothetical protein
MTAGQDYFESLQKEKHNMQNDSVVRSGSFKINGENPMLEKKKLRRESTYL